MDSMGIGSTFFRIGCKCVTKGIIPGSKERDSKLGKWLERILVEKGWLRRSFFDRVAGSIL